MCALLTGTVNGHANGPTTKRSLKPGVYVPTVAFFKGGDNEEVDVCTVKKHAERLACSGIAGIVVQGSNGEAAHLDREERKIISAATRQALDSNGFTSMPLIVGCGAQSTREAIQLCYDAAESGDYVLVLPPCYYKSLVNNEALLQHFRAVADASPLPLLIYNYPGAANGVNLSSDDILTLSKHPKIVGVKLTCGDTGKLARIATSVKPSFCTLGGSADFMLQTLVAGGQGVIAGVANLIPRSCVKVVELYNSGEVQRAQELQAIVARADWVSIKGGFIAVKSGLEVYYGYGGPPRRPCVALSAKNVTVLKEAFEEGMELEMSLAKEGIDEPY